MLRFALLLGCALASPAAASGAQQKNQPPAPLTRGERAAIVDSVRAAVARYYVFPDSATSMVAYLGRRAGSGAYDTITARGPLGAAITRDLQRQYGDAHLRIAYDPQEAAQAADTTRRESRDATARDRANNFWFHELRILPGNIGYVEFTQFPDTGTESRRTVRAAMQFVSHADAVIVDLRGNRGGSAAMAGEIAGWFVRGRAHWSDSYNRLTDQWTEGWVANDSARTDGTVLGMPITVLTSRWTFSAGEGLAYGLQHGRGARVVGERTAGGAHVVRRVPIGGGFLAFVPYIRSANVVTHTDWEGTGVTPDVKVDAADALLRAQEAILLERLARTTDTVARRAVTWALNASRAAATDVAVPAATLARYAGRFEEYTFTVRDGRLVSTNASRGDRVHVLRPVSPTLFSIDDESQVEFVRAPDGAVRQARLLWNDGWVDLIARSR
jgi:hypothetical protein